MKYLDKPCLPETNVALALVSSEYPEIYTCLYEKFNISTIKIEKNGLLADDIATHPDCIFAQVNAENIMINKEHYNNIVNYLTIGGSEINFTASNESVRSPYPFEAALNVRIIGNKIICNTKHIDKNLRSLAEKLNLELVHCNQGYAACSTIMLNDNALITDDETIYRSAINNAIDSIIISKGSVQLKKHKYGFIGGTCGMIAKNLLAFTGSLDSHKDADTIKRFLYKHNINYTELTYGPLIDIGGIIPVLEHN